MRRLGEKQNIKEWDLNFFKLDDEQFESKFQNSLNDTKIYVVGKSRERDNL